jgi:cell wall assembly regulator SMI1
MSGCLSSTREIDDAPTRAVLRSDTHRGRSHRRAQAESLYCWCDGGDRDLQVPARCDPPELRLPGWIPLHWDGNRNYLGIDLDPGPRGVVGQVINFGGDEHSKYVLATSWGRFLEDFADELEAGNFAIGKYKYGACSAMSGSWARGNWPRRFRSRLDYRS